MRGKGVEWDDGDKEPEKVKEDGKCVEWVKQRRDKEERRRARMRRGENQGVQGELRRGRNRKETSEEAALAEHLRPIILLLPLLFHPSSVLSSPSLSSSRL